MNNHPNHIADADKKAQPAPAPQPGMAAFVALADKAADNAFEVIAQLRAHISDLTRRLAEAELEACESMAGAHAEQEVSRHWKEEAEYQNARVRELEATIDAMAEAHAHDDQALTAAYLSGAHAGKKQAEAFKARVMAWARGRCGACEHEGSEDDTCYNCQSDYEQSNWTLPQAWEVGE